MQKFTLAKQEQPKYVSSTLKILIIINIIFPTSKINLRNWTYDQNLDNKRNI